MYVIRFVQKRVLQNEKNDHQANHMKAFVSSYDVCEAN